MECPNCGNDIELELVSCADVKVDRCKECGGIWLDKGEFTRIRKKGDFYIDALDVKEGASIVSDTRKCTKCNKDMDKEIIAGVEVDICRKCMGIWLDQGELRALYNELNK